MSYLATVIIPTYNREKLLYETLYSLEKQTLSKEKFEVIVCDDGSTDRTKEVVHLFKNDLNIKYFFQEDKGFRAAKARNMGIENAEGDICIFIDSSCIASNFFIEEHIKSHTGPRDVVIGDMIGFSQIDNKNREIFKSYDRDNIEESVNQIKKSGGNDIRDSLYKKLGENLMLWGAPWIVFWTGNLSVRKDFLRECGGFDEWFNSWGGEDTELGVNLYVNRGTYKVNRNAIVIHLPHKKSNNFKENPYLAYMEQVKKRRYIHSKYMLFETLAYIYIDTDHINDYIRENREFNSEIG
jgi:Glycosyltransferases involved in cell wall biogenesis